MTPARKREFQLLIDVGNTFLKWGLFRPDHGRQRPREPRRVRPRAARGDPGAGGAVRQVPGAGAHRDLERRRPRASATATIRVLEVWPDAPRAVLARAAGVPVRRAQLVPQSRAARQRPLGGADRRARAAGAARGDGRRLRHGHDDRFPVGRRHVQGRDDHARRRADAALAARRHRGAARPGRRLHRVSDADRSTRSPAVASTRRPARSSACTRRKREADARRDLPRVRRRRARGRRRASRFRSSSTRTSCWKASTACRCRCSAPARCAL